MSSNNANTFTGWVSTCAKCRHYVTSKSHAQIHVIGQRISKVKLLGKHVSGIRWFFPARWNRSFKASSQFLLHPSHVWKAYEASCFEKNLSLLFYCLYPYFLVFLVLFIFILYFIFKVTVDYKVSRGLLYFSNNVAMSENYICFTWQFNILPVKHAINCYIFRMTV